MSHVISNRVCVGVCVCVCVWCVCVCVCDSAVDRSPVQSPPQTLSCALLFLASSHHPHLVHFLENNRKE